MLAHTTPSKLDGRNQLRPNREKCVGSVLNEASCVSKEKTVVYQCVARSPLDACTPESFRLKPKSLSTAEDAFTLLLIAQLN